MTHSEIIAKWPDLAAFAADIGVSENTAKQMRTRDSVNPRYWLAAVSAAKKRSISDVTFEALASAAAEPKQVSA